MYYTCRYDGSTVTRDCSNISSNQVLDYSITCTCIIHVDTMAALLQKIVAIYPAIR